MGNCQAAEVATVVIVHQGGKVERFYWSVSANEIMKSNPGHYLARVVTSASAKSEDGKPLRQLKLLRPDDTLHMGQVYQLICFEDVLKDFATKKCGKLGKLMKETGRIEEGKKRKDKRGGQQKANLKAGASLQMQHEYHQQGSGSFGRGIVGRKQYYQGAQWRPVLQSIEEIGS